MNKSVPITSCNGGIGRKLVSALAADGWKVIGVDCAGAGSPAGGAGGVLSRLHYPA